MDRSQAYPPIPGAGRFGSAALVFIMALAVAGPALALRPFDGTDAAVADVGELEIEFQPAGRLQEGSSVSVLGPVTTLNYGFAKDWEAVVQGQLATPLSSSESPVFNNAALLLKNVLRPGSLQEKSGPSIATEFGVLLPDSGGDSGFGASWAGIASQRFDWGTVHLNLQTQLTREQHADLFIDTIIEGPHTWKVRPVAEFFYECEIGHAQTASALVGLIWQVQDKLAFDLAVREGRTNGQPVNEIRAGLTYSFDLGRPKGSGK
jgi:hypothetical protein